MNSSVDPLVQKQEYSPRTTKTSSVLGVISIISASMALIMTISMKDAMKEVSGGGGWVFVFFLVVIPLMLLSFITSIIGVCLSTGTLKGKMLNISGLMLTFSPILMVIIIMKIQNWQRETHDKKILIIVPTINLVSQMMSDFEDYSQGKFTDMHGISGGVDKNTDKRVVVSTWQSIHKKSAGYFAQFGSVLVDEVHHAQSKSIQGIMNKLVVCPDRIGMTGTIQEAKTHELVLKGLLSIKLIPIVL